MLFRVCQRVGTRVVGKTPEWQRRGEERREYRSGGVLLARHICHGPVDLHPTRNFPSPPRFLPGSANSALLLLSLSAQRI